MFSKSVFIMKKPLHTLKLFILAPTRSLHQLFLFLYCSLVFWVSHQSSVPLPDSFPYFDKIIHATTYFVMACLAYRCFPYFSKKTCYQTILFCLLFGATDEWHQSFIVGRFTDPYDWAADALGATIAVLFLQNLKIRNTPSSK